MSSTPQTGGKEASLSPILANLRARDLSSAVQALAEAKAKRSADSEALKRAILSRTVPAQTGISSQRVLETHHNADIANDAYHEHASHLSHDNMAGSPWGPEDAEFIKRAVEEELSSVQDPISLSINRSSMAASSTIHSEVSIEKKMFKTDIF
jgi:hypothetical protein